MPDTLTTRESQYRFQGCIYDRYAREQTSFSVVSLRRHSTDDPFATKAICVRIEDFYVQI
jgi:hypothetical protein